MSDLIPNEGNFYTPEPDEQDTLELNAERTKALEALPLLEEVIEWFDKQIDEINRVTAIDLDSKLSAEEQIHGHQVAVKLLNQKKGEFATLLETYKPKR